MEYMVSAKSVVTLEEMRAEGERGSPDRYYLLINAESEQEALKKYIDQVDETMYDFDVEKCDNS